MAKYDSAWRAQTSRHCLSYFLCHKDRQTIRDYFDRATVKKWIKMKNKINEELHSKRKGVWVVWGEDIILWWNETLFLYFTTISNSPPLPTHLPYFTSLHLLFTAFFSAETLQSNWWVFRVISGMSWNNFFW